MNYKQEKAVNEVFGQSGCANSHGRSQVFGREFLQAYASPNRLEGNCRISLVWKRGSAKREIEIHTGLLCFNHEGVKEYETVKFVNLPEQRWKRRFTGDLIPLDLLEAAALIQDAYQQNVRFKTSPAPGFKRGWFLLSYDTQGIRRDFLMNKLHPRCLTVSMFANVYLAALRRMDHGLVYDLSSPRRKEMLGERSAFLLDAQEEWQRFVFLKTEITILIKENTKTVLRVYVTVSNAANAAIRLTYQMIIVKSRGYYYIDDFHLLERKVLEQDHADNPLQGYVFCYVYPMVRHNHLQDWLEENPDIFVSGETETGLCYKWIKDEECTYENYDISDRVIGEFLLLRQETVIVTHKIPNAVRLEKIMTEKFSQEIRFPQKYYLPVQVFFRMICRASFCWEELDQYRVVSALLRLKDDQHSLERFLEMMKDKQKVGNQIWYYYPDSENKEEDQEKQIEYYKAGNWIKINVFNGDIGKEIAYLRDKLKIDAVIYSYELENNFDFDKPTVTEERKWEICGLLRRFHKEFAQTLGRRLMPLTREIAAKMGTVIG